MEVELLGTQERWQEDLFVAGPLSSLIPDDHILKQVDGVLDLSWLRSEVSDLYCRINGRPGIDPEAAVINLKRLAMYADSLFDDFFNYLADILTIASNRTALKMILTNRIYC